MLTQDLAGFIQQRPWLLAPLSEAIGRVMGLKGIGHLIAVQMHRRGDDVAGMLLAELDDVLAQIGFHRADVVGFEERIQADFLADHALALGDEPGVH